MKLTELKNCVKVEVANRILPALSEYAVCGGEAAEGMWVGVVGGGGGGVLLSLQVFSCLIFPAYIYMGQKICTELK